MNDKPIKVLIVHDKAEMRRNIRRVLEPLLHIEVVGTARNGIEAIMSTRRGNPDVILMDVHMPVMDGIHATRFISTEMPTAAIVMIASHRSDNFMRLALKAGARDYLVIPFSNDLLIETIESVYRIEAARRRALGVPLYGPFAKKIPRAGRVVSIMGTKGGVGTTTVAVNTAVTLASHFGLKICLIDCDFMLGDVALQLDLQPRLSIADVARCEPPWMTNDVLQCMTRHEDSGIDVLSCPLRPEDSEDVDGQHLKKVIHLLRPKYDVIILDVPPNFDARSLVAIDCSDIVLAVSGQDMSCLKNARVCLELLHSLNVPSDKIAIAANRVHTTHMGLDIDDVQCSLAVALSVVIPAMQHAMTAAINSGQPIMAASPPVLLEQAFSSLASFLVKRLGLTMAVTEEDRPSLIERFTKLFRPEAAAA